MSNRLVQLELYPLRLPFRSRFSHAAAERTGTDTVVAMAVLADGTVGFGEGVPRPYVTGETVESVLFSVGDVLVDSLGGVEPKRWADLLELANNLPFANAQGQVINTARCCVELALLDAYGRHFGQSLSGIADWLGFGGFAGPGSIETLRVSGVLDSGDPGRLARRGRLMWWYGLRDFKLKMGGERDQENLEVVRKVLGDRLRSRRASLRVDANGAWDVDTAVGMSEMLASLGVCCLEQPLAAGDRSHMQALADLTDMPLMADESLVSFDDAEYLAENDLVDYFNIRISKNGGLLAALRMAEIASNYGRGCQLGAMVGETGILAAAGRHFLQMVPNISFTEICYSTFLLREDVVEPSLRFGYGGKLGRLTGPGLGVKVRRDRIEKFISGAPRKFGLG